MDGRIALTPGTRLEMHTKTGYTEYTVRREIGRGGSCIVYDASYTDNLGNDVLVRIKECCPHALNMTRDAEGVLHAPEKDRAAFDGARQRLRDAYRMNLELFSADRLANAAACVSDFYEANGTVYIVSAYTHGRTFAEYQGDTLHDCIRLMLGTADALKRLHEAGFLYLDLKPENILTVQGSLDLVQLFDFDSVLSMEELARAVEEGKSSGLRMSYTRDYAPLEQQTAKLRQLKKHSDFYSLGAVLFYALWHRPPSAFDCGKDAEYDYASCVYSARRYQDRLYRALTAFFRRTLASYGGDRFQTDEEVMACLQEILALSDETRPYLRSSPVGAGAVFYGREEELEALRVLLMGHRRQTVSLYGMGGIGKSTLVRRYLLTHGADWDGVLWLYDQGNLPDMLADDILVHVHTVSRAVEESTAQYLKRKLEVLSSLAAEQSILLVLDNFTPENMKELEPLRELGLTVLLISRERPADGLFPAMAVGRMDGETLERLFAHYSGRSPEDEEEQKSLRGIIDAVEGHTLLTELIARQVAKSYLDLASAEAMMAQAGFAALPEEKIDYVHDREAYHGTLIRILDRLVEADHFTQTQRQCMKLLSLFDAPGIEAGLFRTLSGLPSLDVANELESAGWLKTESRTLCLHPVMQEYIRTWPWDAGGSEAADRMMRNLYAMIRPAGRRHDGNKQYPDDYESLYRLLCLADQMIRHAGEVTEASQRLLCRILLDAPVDQDAAVLFRMLDVLEDPRYLDDGSILRLYENAAYLRARLYAPEEAVDLLGEMKRYLRTHPSAYYLSAYHRAMAVILHNADEYGNLKKCLRHEDRAIAAARLSTHPDAQKQLAGSLLEKATTLLSADMDRKQAGRLILEAGPIVERSTGRADYERYQYACVSAMYYAMEGNLSEAEERLRDADEIAFLDPDSDLAAAEHLIEQAAPIRIAMEQFEAAAEAVRRAILLCEKHDREIRYRETRFDALLFLGRIYAMNHEYTRAEATFAEAEKWVDDSPYQWKLPLCPGEIREKAKAERAQGGLREKAVFP